MTRRLHGKATITDAITASVTELLVCGNSVEDACAGSGINSYSYYHWRSKGEKRMAEYTAYEDSELDPDGKERKDIIRDPYVEFYLSTTDALAQSRIGATKALTDAIGGRLIEKIIRHDTVLKTSLKKLVTRFEDGRVVTSYEPYEDRYELFSEQIRHLPPDARMAVELLKRRDPAHWSEKIEASDWKGALVALIQAGEITYETLSDAFGENTTQELYAGAEADEEKED